MSWPSKDPRDYRSRPRPAPRWLAWMVSDSGVPYRTHFAAGAGGVIAAAMITGDLLGGLGGGLLAQAILDVAARPNGP